jgi:hypothetical protein
MGDSKPTTEEETMENWDERVSRALALLQAADTAKQTGSPTEIAGVKIFPCDDHGRIDPRVSVEYWPEDGFPMTPEGSDDAAQAVEGAGMSRRTHQTETPFGTALVTTEHRTRLYIAGTISGDDRPFEEKRDAFYMAAAALRDKGFDTVNPLDVGNDLCLHGPDNCHENTVRRLKGKDQGAGHSWECYLRHDMIELLQCDGVALLDNWHLSPGARAEFDLANTVGLPCKPAAEWLAPAPGSARWVQNLRQTDFTRCARCGGVRAAHHPAGARSFCDFAGPGAATTCAECGCEIQWDGQKWWDNHPTGDLCSASKDPDAAHVPADTGEQR